jgi:feruloyl esterase
MKIMQEYPELYDGYLIAQPAPNIAKFGTSGLYPQIVMKTELGFTAVNKDAAKAFAAKVAAANARAVAACDTAGLGFLLNPFACNYNPARDAAALCAGAIGDGVTGSNADAASCMSAKEATALNKIWYGLTPDGSFDAAQTPDSRSGKTLGAKQVWWTFTRGTAIGGQITRAGTWDASKSFTETGADIFGDPHYRARESIVAISGCDSGSRVHTGVSAGSTSAVNAAATLEKILNIAFSLRFVTIVDG